ncbi:MULTISPECIES: cupin domain-containing protein [Lysinibacillus]|uniref:cupin domain-containing protein n=1 Tax=Lysinibacillus TaxID=400634 RepID=UPI00083C97EF|nr:MULTISPECIES: cupin domain-containing protein [Lysinibacillus]
MNPILEKMNLLQTVSDISEYTNFIVSEVNDHVVRIAVIDGEYHWHEHDTDELFMVLEGELFIDLENNETISLLPGEIFKVPAFTQHRTRSTGRTVNLCFEKKENDIKGKS